MARSRRAVEEVQLDIQAQTKVCCVCEERKDFGKFYNSKSQPDGKGYRCKSCDDKAKKRWAERNPERLRESQRRNLLWTSYRITPVDYDTMLTEQDGGCAICGLPEADNKIAGKYNCLSVDHDHKTGKVRGLLCNQCNRGLGFLQDSSVLLRRAANYLEEEA